MISKLWSGLGIAAYWVSWPVLVIYFRMQERTRVVIIANNRILVLKPWMGNGKWILPGGGLHTGETPRDGALREIKEEIGLEVAPEELSILTDGKHEQYGHKYTYHAYWMELPHQSAIELQRFEIREAGWIPIEKVLGSAFDQDVHNCLEAWRKR